MEEAWQPEAVQNRKLEQLKASMYDYIEKNIEKIDSNLPVFFGHVTATLEKSFPALDDRAHDEFIDAVTFKFLDTTHQPPTPEFLDKVLWHAIGNKRRRKGRATLDIIAGLKLINAGRYTQAIEYMTKYRNYDGRINTAIGYCYYALSIPLVPPPSRQTGPRPNDMELQAREEMLTLARTRPPLNRLKVFDIKDYQLNKIFWFMIDRALQWFPNEPEYLRIGLKRARIEGDNGRRSYLIRLATERFHDDKRFLVEAFNFRIEQRNGRGAAAVVKQMMQQYPDDLEPIYFGIKLAIMGTQPSSYYSFRKLAILKEFPQYLLRILDFLFAIMCDRKNEAYVCFEEIRKGSSRGNYYLTALEYMLRDIFEGDEERAKRAKAAIFSTIDQYCMQALNIRHD